MMSEVLLSDVDQDRIARITSSVQCIMKYALDAVNGHDQHINGIGSIFSQYRNEQHVSTSQGNKDPEIVTLSVNAPEVGISGAINSYNDDDKGRICGIFLEPKLKDGKYVNYVEVRQTNKLMIGKPSYDKNDTLLPPSDNDLNEIENKLLILKNCLEEDAKN